MSQIFKYTHTVPEVDLNNEEFCYWLGFILADGCISSGEKYANQRLIVGLNKKDFNHLKKLQKWLKSNHPIYIRKKYNACEIRIRSQKLANLFISFGITPKKSLTVKVDKRLQNNRHFWRGVVDGDGTLYWNKRDQIPVLGLLGTFDVCQRFYQYYLYLDNTFNKVNISKPPWNGYSFKTSGKRAISVIKNLYENSSIYLDRKYKLAMEYI